MFAASVQAKNQRGLCVAHGLLFGHDPAVASWAWNAFKMTPMHFNAAIGIIRKRELVGAAIFQEFSGYNVELSYYGPETFSAGIARTLARYTIQRFNTVDRLTMRTNRKNIAILKMFQRFGFRSEGIQHRFYGPFGDAAVFVLFREDLERIAKLAKGGEK